MSYNATKPTTVNISAHHFYDNTGDYLGKFLLYSSYIHRNAKTHNIRSVITYYAHRPEIKKKWIIAHLEYVTSVAYIIIPIKYSDHHQNHILSEYSTILL